MLTEREYKYWLTRNCPRQFCWVVAARLGEMISHKDTRFFDDKGQSIDSIALTHESLQYIYFAIVDNDKLLTLVEDPSGYYIIENSRTVTEKEEQSATDGTTEDDEILINSEIRYSRTLDGILSTMSRGKQKQLGIKRNDKCKLRSAEVTALKGIVHIDFINKSPDEKQGLWNKYVKSCDKTLDLSGFHTLDINVLRKSPVKNERVTSIILYQNIHIYELDWLDHFPNLELISAWFINMMQDCHLDALVYSARKLQTFELHHCYQITGRALLHLSRLPLLSKIIIDNDQLPCQDNPFRTIILREEWESMDNRSVEFIMLNSNNLTLDYINFTLGAFKVLRKFVMNDIILDKLYKNTYSGEEKEKVVFQSVSDGKRGFGRFRDVKVYGLLCSQVDDNVFSDSMLERIKSQNPEKAGITDILARENYSASLPVKQEVENTD